MKHCKNLYLEEKKGTNYLKKILFTRKQHLLIKLRKKGYRFDDSGLSWLTTYMSSYISIFIQNSNYL